MLNGDVLTDIDLSAQIAQHEATGATATLALVPVEDPTAYGLVRLRRRPRGLEFVEKPSADQIDTNLISRRRLRARALRARPDPGRPQRLDRARGLAAARRRGALRLRRADAYWLDIGTPERYLQGTFDILEGNVATGGADRLGARLPGRRRARRTLDGRIVPPALVERGCTIAAGAHVGALVVLGDGRRRRARATTIERARRPQRRADRRPTAPCATASSPPACASATATAISGGAVLGEGVTIGAAQRPLARRASLPADRPTRQAPSRSEEGTSPTLSSTEQLDARPRDDRPGRSDRPAHRRPRDSRSTCATRCGRSSRPALEPWDSPGGLIVAGMGGSAIGGQPGPRDPRRPRLAPAAGAPAPTGCRRGRRPTRPSCARPTRATPRRRSPATRRRA